MPYLVDASDADPIRRTLIVGAPNTLKTTALLGWPRPTHIVSCPGEKGYETIPRGEPGLFSYIWQSPVETLEALSPYTVVTEFESLCFTLLAGGHGSLTTLALDGIHKQYGWYYRRARLGLEGTKLPDEAKDAKAWGLAHDEFLWFFSKILHAPAPYVACTVWGDGVRDDPKLPKSPSHIFPDLPGKMARWIVGEFPTVVYSDVTLPDPQGRVRAVWQLRPRGEVWGVGIKTPPDRAMQIPTTCEGSFQALSVALAGPRMDTPVQQEKTT